MAKEARKVESAELVGELEGIGNNVGELIRCCFYKYGMTKYRTAKYLTAFRGERGWTGKEGNSGVSYQWCYNVLASGLKKGSRWA